MALGMEIDRKNVADASQASVDNEFKTNQDVGEALESRNGKGSDDKEEIVPIGKEKDGDETIEKGIKNAAKNIKAAVKASSKLASVGLPKKVKSS